MSVRKAEDSNRHYPYFADVQSSCVKIKDMWCIDSLNIKFKESNSNAWLKLYEMLHYDNCLASSANLAKIIESKSIKDSDEYIKGFLANNQPFILKSIDILINDNRKMRNLGEPIKLISHDLYNNKDSEINVIFCWNGELNFI